MRVVNVHWNSKGQVLLHDDLQQKMQTPKDIQLISSMMDHHSLKRIKHLYMGLWLELCDLSCKLPHHMISPWHTDTSSTIGISIYHLHIITGFRLEVILLGFWHLVLKEVDPIPRGCALLVLSSLQDIVYQSYCQSYCMCLWGCKISRPRRSQKPGRLWCWSSI